MSTLLLPKTPGSNRPPAFTQRQNAPQNTQPVPFRIAWYAQSSLIPHGPYGVLLNPNDQTQLQGNLPSEASQHHSISSLIDKAIQCWLTPKGKALIADITSKFAAQYDPQRAHTYDPNAFVNYLTSSRTDRSKFPSVSLDFWCDEGQDEQGTCWVPRFQGQIPFNQVGPMRNGVVACAGFRAYLFLALSRSNPRDYSWRSIWAVLLHYAFHEIAHLLVFFLSIYYLHDSRAGDDPAECQLPRDPEPEVGYYAEEYFFGGSMQENTWVDSTTTPGTKILVPIIDLGDSIDAAHSAYAAHPNAIERVYAAESIPALNSNQELWTYYGVQLIPIGNGAHPWQAYENAVVSLNATVGAHITPSNLLQHYTNGACPPEVRNWIEQHRGDNARLVPLIARAPGIQQQGQGAQPHASGGQQNQQHAPAAPPYQQYGQGGQPYQQQGPAGQSYQQHGQGGQSYQQYGQGSQQHGPRGH